MNGAISSRTIADLETEEGVRQGGPILPAVSFGPDGRLAYNGPDPGLAYKPGKMDASTGTTPTLGYAQGAMDRHSSALTGQGLPAEDIQWAQEALSGTGDGLLGMTPAEQRAMAAYAKAAREQGKDASQMVTDYRIGRALSVVTGLPVHEATAAADEISEYLTGNPLPKTYNGVAALRGWWRTGWYTTRMTDAYGRWAAADEKYGPDAPETLALRAEADRIAGYYEYERDTKERGALGTGAQAVVSNVPYILDTGTGGFFTDMARGDTAAAAKDMGLTLGSLALSFIPGLPGWVAAVPGAWARFANSYEGFRGTAYKNMLDAGVSRDTALRISKVDGVINGLNETLLDSLTGTAFYGATLGRAQSTLFIPALRKVAGMSAVAGFGTALARFVIGEGVQEGVQEWSESLTSSFLQAVAEYEDEVPFSTTIQGALADAFEEGLLGFAVGVTLGIPGAITASRADMRSVSRLKENAVTEFSERAYVSSAENRETLSGMGFLGGEASEAQKDSILRKVWEDAAPGREKALKARADAVSGNGTASSEAIRRNQQEPERMPDGTIRHKDVDTERDSDGDGAVSYTVRFASKTARAEGGNATTYGTVKITVSKDGKTAEITGVDIDDSYLSVGAEMVRTAIIDYAPGAEVSWDTGDRADLEALKLAVVNSSPNGTLRFGADGEAAAGLASVRNEILSVRSVGPDEATALAGLVSALAKAEGLSVEEFLGRHTPKGSLIQGPDRKMLSEIRRIQEANGYGSLSELVRAENARRNLLTPEQLRMAEAFETDENNRALHTGAYVSLANGMRGVIYASKASDVSTFVHELFHFAADISPERRAELIKALRETAEDEKRSGRLKEFIRENGEIFMRCSSSDVREAEGIDAKAEAVIRLFRDLPDDGTWGIDAEEAAASLYEAYMAHPRTERLSDKVKQALRKIAQWMRGIYKSLREGTLLDQSISDAYNALMGYVPGEGRENTQASPEDAPGAREQADSGESRKQGSAGPDGIYTVDEQVRYQENPDYKPEKVGHGYKLFEMDTRDGKLYPLFLGKRTPTPVGVWLMAEDNYITSDNPVKNKGTGARQFAARPGWHIGGTIPDAPWLRGANGQYNSKRGKSFRRVWAEVSYPMDVDYQAEADANASRDIKGHIPADGYYLFNESNRGTWVITGALRVDRVLSDEEVSSILKERGYDAEAAFEPYRKSFEKRKETGKSKAKFQSSLSHAPGFHTGENALGEAVTDEGQILPFSVVSELEDETGIQLGYGITLGEAYDRLYSEMEGYDKPEEIAEILQSVGIKALSYSRENGSKGYVFLDGRVRHSSEWYETEERLEKEGGHYDSDGNPLAPNGKKSNLTEEQYITVRTPSFKKWFGDWEAAPESASKVVDENGEPLVVYHGTSSAGFTEFASQKGTAFGGTPAHTSWFSSSRPSAGTYTFSQDGAHKNGYKDIPEGLYAKPDPAGYGLDRPASRGIYAVFLALRNPIVYDYDGYMADGQPVRKHVLYSGQGPDVSPVRNPDGTVRVFESWSELTDYRNGVLNASGEWLREGEIGYDGRLWTNVRSLWRAEKETGHRPDAKLGTNKAVRDAMAAYPDSDGVIFKNIRDSAGYEDRYKGNVYVVFSPSQIKSATENTGTFDPADGDIRYQATRAEAYESLREAGEAIVSGAEEAVINDARSDLGQYSVSNDVKIIWGNEKKGLFHIGYRRGADVVANVLRTVIDGEISRYTPGKRTVNIVWNGYEAVLSLDMNGEDETWLLTGWRVNRPDATSEVGTQLGATQDGPTFSRSELGAGLKRMLSEAEEDVNGASGPTGRLREAYDFERRSLTNGDETLMEAAEGHTIVYTDSDGRLRFQRAWHGTGASFDRFSTEHIGEGEGQQAFGWGLYFSDNKEIARGYAERIGTSLEETIAKIKNGIAYGEACLERYRETLRYMSSPEGLVAWNDSKLVRAIRLDERLSRAQHEESDPKGLLTGAYDTARAVQREHPDASGEEVLRLVWEARLAWLRRHIEDIEGEIKEARDEIASAAGLGPSAFGHYLYEVDIPDGPYLDWYEPVPDPEKVGSAFWEHLTKNNEEPYLSLATLVSSFKEGTLAEMMADTGDNIRPQEMSALLSRLGYVGIRYPANSLSGHSDGTSHNYVIFNGEDVKITSRTRFQEARARGEAVRADLSSIEGVELSADAAVHEEDGLEGIRALWQDSMDAGDSPDTGDASGEASLSLPDVTYVDTSRLKIPGLTGSDATKDRAFTEAMADDEALSALLKDLGDNSDRVEKWVAEIVEAAQERELTAEELDKARDAFNASPRFYRDLIGRIYGRADLRAAEVSGEGQEMAPIATPDEDVDAAYRGISVTQRKRIAGKLSPELAKAFADGTETLDGAVEKELERLEKEGEELEKAKARAESELAEAKKNAGELEKKLAATRKENSSLSGKLKRRDAKIASLQGEAKDARALEAELRRERKKVETRERWLEDYKKSVKEREKKKGDLRKMRAYKQRLARSLSRRWSPSVDFRTVAPILSEIASKLDPRFVRDWAYDPRTNPEGESGGGTISFEDLRKLHDGGQLDEGMRAALGAKLWNRLEGEGRKPLNDWTIAELEELNDRLNFQWELGRRREALRRSEINGRRRGYADGIIGALRSVPGYDSSVRAEGAERPGERGARLWRKRYAFLRMQELALKLDGDTGEKGENWALLIERQRKAHDAELRETDRRTAPVIEAIKAYNKEHGRNAFEAEMYRKAYEVELSPGVTQEFTAQALAYAYLAADNVKAREAVAYGNLVDQQEKAAIKRSYDGARMDARTEKELKETNARMEQEVRGLGDARFEALYAKAKEVLDETGLMPVVDAVKADLRAPENGQRLLDMSLDLFNRPVVLEENYLPLRRTDVTGDEVKSVKDISMATGNYLAKAEDGFMREKLVIAPINQTPARLALMDVWTDSVGSQEHLIAYAGLLGDLNSVYEKNRAVTDAIKRAWGREMLTEIDDYLQYVADPEYGDVRNDVSRLLTALRGSLSTAYLGWKLSGVLVQLITSPAPFLGEVGTGQLLNGFVQLAVRPGEMREFIESRSVMMKHRSGNMIIGELRAMAEGDREARLPERFRNSFNEMGMRGLEWADWYTVSAGWLAKYNETLEAETEAGATAGEAERKAVDAADEMVLRTQPNGGKTEAARLFRSSNAALRALLQFQASLNVVFNNLTADLRYDWKQRGTDSEAFRRIIGHIAGYAGAGIILGLIQDGWDDDDDEDRAARRARKVLYWGLSQGLESVPVISGNVDDIVHAAVTGEYSAGYRSTSVYPMVSDISTGLSRMLSARTAEEPMEAFLKGLQSFGYGLGYAIGIPVSALKQLERSIKAGTGEGGIMAKVWPFLGRY